MLNFPSLICCFSKFYDSGPMFFFGYTPFHSFDWTRTFVGSETFFAGGTTENSKTFFLVELKTFCVFCAASTSLDFILDRQFPLGQNVTLQPPPPRGREVAPAHRSGAHGRPRGPTERPNSRVLTLQTWWLHGI